MEFLESTCSSSHIQTTRAPGEVIRRHERLEGSSDVTSAWKGHQTSRASGNKKDDTSVWEGMLTVGRFHESVVTSQGRRMRGGVINEMKRFRSTVARSSPGVVHTRYGVRGLGSVDSPQLPIGWLKSRQKKILILPLWFNSRK